MRAKNKRDLENLKEIIGKHWALRKESNLTSEPELAKEIKKKEMYGKTKAISLLRKLSESRSLGSLKM